MQKDEIIRHAIESIRIESAGVENLIHQIDDQFAEIVQCLAASKGRIILTGIGKSAIVAQKIVATLNSTGSPSIFMHAADAIHGDLGIIQPDDVVICISKSGNTPEIKLLVPLIRNMGNTIIGMVADLQSYLAKNSDHVLKTPVSREACPNNLAPTTSTTVQMVMGDALAVSLLHLHGFSSGDFAKVHPGGALGKKLYTRVEDLYRNNEKPMVKRDESIKNTILEISGKRLGATAVVDENENLLGVITDGDIRRMLEKFDNFLSLQAKDIMSTKPKTIGPEELAYHAFQVMEKNSITQLIVSSSGNYLGIIHLHDILREGIV
jgi:arabinose-5-phosphate isomerase